MHGLILNLHFINFIVSSFIYLFFHWYLVEYHLNKGKHKNKIFSDDFLKLYITYLNVFCTGTNAGTINYIQTGRLLQQQNLHLTWIAKQNFVFPFRKITWFCIPINIPPGQRTTWRGQPWLPGCWRVCCYSKL